MLILPLVLIKLITNDAPKNNSDNKSNKIILLVIKLGCLRDDNSILEKLNCTHKYKYINVKIALKTMLNILNAFVS